jgi:hypothetical protein
MDTLYGAIVVVIGVVFFYIWKALRRASAADHQAMTT